MRRFARSGHSDGHIERSTKGSVCVAFAEQQTGENSTIFSA